jgi:hypothetical protein
LTSAKAQTILERLSGRCLEDGQQHLVALLRRLQTVHVWPNPEVLRTVTGPVPSEQAMEMAYLDPLPDFLRWLSPLSVFLPSEVRLVPEARYLMLELGNIWQRFSEPKWKFRQEFFELADRLLPGLDYFARRDLADISRQDADRAQCLARRIILLSAPDHPEEAAALLRALVDSHRDFGEKEVLSDTFLLPILARAIPQALEDFAYSVSVDARRYLPGEMNFADLNCGFNGDEFSPVHDRHGVFLALFGQAEANALSLVRRLCNHGTEYWKRREEEGQQIPYGRSALHPLPINIAVLERTFSFHGDESIYCWFRPYSTVPGPVGSALLAFESWLLEQLDGGRDIRELIELALTGNECVAVVGILLGLLYDRMLQVATVLYPLATYPLLYRFDNYRATAELHGSALLQLTALRSRAVAERLVERDKNRQRRLRPHWIAPYFLFDERIDLDARVGYLSRMNMMAPAFVYREEADDAAGQQQGAHEVEVFQAFAQRENYSPQVFGGEFVLPAHLRPATNIDNESEFLEMELRLWSESAFESRRSTSGQAVARARTLARHIPTNQESLRDGTGARLAVAAAVLEPGIADEPELIGWATAEVKHVLTYMRGRNWEIDATEGAPHSATMAARGLARLLIANSENIALRREAGYLIGHASVAIICEFLKASQALWQVADAWMCELLSSAIGRTTTTNNGASGLLVVRHHTNWTAQTSILLAVPESVTSGQLACTALYRGYVDSLLEHERGHTDSTDRTDLDRSDNLAVLVLREVLFAEETRATYVLGLLTDFIAAPWLYLQALRVLSRFFVRSGLTDERLSLWSRLCDGFLDHVPDEFERQDLPQVYGEIVRALVLVEPIVGFITAELWPQATRMIATWKKLAMKIGAHPEVFKSLSAALMHHAVLPGRDIVEILLDARAATTDLARMLGDQGAYYASQALHRAWGRDSQAIRADHELTARLAQFTAELATSEQIAAHLLQQIERSGAGNGDGRQRR